MFLEKWQPGWIASVACAAALMIVCLVLPQARAQAAASSDQSLGSPSSTLFRAYKYAFHIYARYDARAAAQEYKGESGIELRDTLQFHFGLSDEQFTPFQNAAIDYLRAESSAEDRLSAIRQADRAMHPNPTGLSTQARAKEHQVFAELTRTEAEAVNSIHQTLDAPTAKKLDDAVTSFYSDARANRPESNPLAIGMLTGFASSMFGGGATDREELSSVTPLDTDPGGGSCALWPEYYLDEQEDNCTAGGGLWSSEACQCDTSGGGPEGGGGDETQPVILEISPLSFLVGAVSVNLTISGANFGSSPKVNLPTGVTTTGQISSDSQIVITLNIGFNAAVGPNTISVTANGQPSNSVALGLDGPYELIVENDSLGTCTGCSTTVQRKVTYQIQSFSQAPEGSTTICEQPIISGWNCSGSLNIVATYCPGTPNQASSPTDSLPNGQFTDQWSLSSDGWSPIGCGFGISDTWDWLTPSSTVQELGKPSGYVHTNAVQIDGVTSSIATPAQIPAGTVMPK